jgi:hypothetical protein
MKNKTDKKMTFERLILEYIIAGKYRGEWLYGKNRWLGCNSRAKEK